MNKALLVLLLAASSLQAHAIDAIPADLVGEWRNSKDRTSYAAIYLYSNGHGGLLGINKGDAVGGKISGTYNSRQHQLTVITPAEGFGGGRQTYQFDYDSTAKTLTGRDPEWGKPFRRLSAKVPKEIEEQLQFK